MTSRPAKILFITRNFPPLWGGMERLNLHLAEALVRQAQIHLIAPAGAAAHAPAGVMVSEVPLKPLGRFLGGALCRAVAEARRFSPDVVLAGSGLTAPLALMAARLTKASAVAYVHGLDLTAVHPIYRCLWLPAIRRLDRVLANSRATVDLAMKAGVAQARITLVHPSVALPALDMEKRRLLRQAFRAQHGLGDRPLLLSVGRLTTRKGLIPFVREVLPALVAARPQLCLLIVGDAPKDALAAEVEPPAAILAAARAVGVEHNVRLLGFVPEHVLTAAFCAADVHVFPVRALPQDPEGFGMVAIEAAAHGLPTVTYATGGVVDAVAEGVSGWLVPNGDSAGFAHAVMRLLDSPLSVDEIQNFARGFAWARFAAQVAEALDLSAKHD